MSCVEIKRKMGRLRGVSQLGRITKEGGLGLRFVSAQQKEKKKKNIKGSFGL